MDRKRKITGLKINLKSNQRKIAINKKQLARLAQQVLKSQGVTQAELSILLVSPQRIRALNKKYRGTDRVTDVLAFSMREGKDTRLHAEILGDVVICPEVAQKAARLYRTSRQYEINLYLVHGILHLLGYRDQPGPAHREMEKEQLRILKTINPRCKIKI